MSRTRTAVLRKVVRSAAALEQPAATDRELLRRFARENDQRAFEALVVRHTAMVLGVCRRALANVQDAEDACQATFLVLANHAKDGRWQESVANWLYTTARKVAHNARVAAQRRARRESGAAVPEAVEPVDRMTGRELLAALDAALDALPARYREPLVLCYLEGLTRDEAAARLGVPLATLHTRIDRARKRLHAVLTKAGCALGAGLLALAVTSPAGASPPRLVGAILAAASGVPPAAVGELAKGVAVNGVFNKLKLALAAVVVVALGAGLGTLGTSAASPPSDKPAPATEKEKAQPKDAPAKPAAEEATVSGRVLDPDGKPLGGAKILVGRAERPLEVGTSDADGKFKVAIPAKEQGALLLARADGVGLDFRFVPPDKLGDEVELRTVNDHAIRGRVVDPQGKPVAGATVNVSGMAVYPGESLDGFLAEFKRGGYPSAARSLGPDANVLPAATTDKDGRFTITGAGAERVVVLRVKGTGLAEGEVTLVNRKDFDPNPYNEPFPAPRPGSGFMPPKRLDRAAVLYGPEPTVVAEPEKRVRGRVTDADTGKPRAGVKVVVWRDSPGYPPLPLSGTTDADGRYDVGGARKSAAYTVLVDGDPDTRHVAARVQVDDTAGYEPINADVKVKKGVVVTGKVLDAITKKPVRAFVSVSVMHDNEFVTKYPEGAQFAGINMHPTAADGTYRLVTIPGPVLLMGGAYPDRAGNVPYKLPVADPDYPQYFVNRLSEGRPVYIGYPSNTEGIVHGNFCKVLDLKPDTETVTQDILLEPEK